MSKDTRTTNYAPEVIVGITLKQAEWLEKQTVEMQSQGLTLLNMLHQRSQTEILSKRSALNLELLIEQTEILRGIIDATRKGISEK